MVSYTLPQPLRHLSTVGQVLMVVLLIKHLGEPITFPATSRVSDCLYRALGVLALMAQATWFLTPLSFAKTGMPLLVLWSLFVTWSTLRLVHLLGQETVVNGQVLMGAAAGYLMLGLTAGLLLSVLETVHPGSFTSVHNEGGQLLVPRLRGLAPVQVWELDFVRLNYFAFVSLTTVGYGDILPVTPVAQIASVSFSVIGPFYLAVVMGLLISRFTIQEANQGKDNRSGDGEH